MDYQQQNDYDGNYYPEDGGYENGPDNVMVKGLKIAIAVLILLILILAFLFWNRVRQDNQEAEMMRIEMDTLRSNIGTVRQELGQIKSENDSLNQDLELQKNKADSLLTALSKEKRYRYSVVKKYEKELGTLRAAMKGFVRQIDSLNRVNKKLVGENIAMKKSLASYKMRAESAEETASEYKTKVDRGSVVNARSISFKPLNNRNKPATRAKNTKTLEVNFVLAANELANPGPRTVYVSIISPSGSVISPNNSSIQIEGQSVPYTDSRDVDYTGSDLPVAVYCHGENFTTGKYTVNIYMDGHFIGGANFGINK